MQPKFDCIFILISHDHESLAKSSLASLRKFLKKSPLKTKIMFFDNGSAVSQKNLVMGTDVDFIRLKEVVGFAGGGNYIFPQVLRRYVSKYIALVSNDIFFDATTPEELSKFLKKMQKTKNAAATPSFFVDKECTRVENLGLHFYSSGLVFKKLTPDSKPYVLSGACLFLNAKVCEQLIKDDGFIFQPDYFLNAEDVELSLRLLSRGYSIFISPSFRVQHLGSATLSEVSASSLFYYWRNTLWTIYIVSNNRELVSRFVWIFFGQIILLCQTVIDGHSGMLLKVWKQTILNRRKLSVSRKNWQKKRKNAVLGQVIFSGVFPFTYHYRLFSHVLRRVVKK